MSILIFLSEVAVPLVIVAILGHGYMARINIYEAFIDGAKDGLVTVYNIVPTLIGLMVAVGIFSASGALGLITSGLSPITTALNFPTEALPLALMRLVSSAAASSIMLDIFKNFGPDSFLGRYVSIMMSSTETIFYTMSVYFMSVKITKTRHTLLCALISNLVGVVLSLYVTQVVFGS